MCVCKRSAVSSCPARLDGHHDGHVRPGECQPHAGAELALREGGCDILQRLQFALRAGLLLSGASESARSVKVKVRVATPQLSETI